MHEAMFVASMEREEAQDGADPYDSLLVMQADASAAEASLGYKGSATTIARKASGKCGKDS